MDNRIFWLKGELKELSQNFMASEFECSCGCIVHTLDMELIRKLELLRKRVGKPIKVHSGMRCRYNNMVQGGKPFSQHLVGKAADISWAGWTGQEMEKVASEFFDSIGVGEKFIHVDTRSGRRRWTYGKN